MDIFVIPDITAVKAALIISCNSSNVWVWLHFAERVCGLLCYITRSYQWLLTASRRGTNEPTQTSQPRLSSHSWRVEKNCENSRRNSVSQLWHLYFRTAAVLPNWGPPVEETYCHHQPVLQLRGCGDTTAKSGLCWPAVSSFLNVRSTLFIMFWGRPSFNSTRAWP